MDMPLRGFSIAFISALLSGFPKREYSPGLALRRVHSPWQTGLLPTLQVIPVYIFSSQAYRTLFGDCWTALPQAFREQIQGVHISQLREFEDRSK